MIQDIFPHRLRNEFIMDMPVDPEGWLFRFGEGGLMCRTEDDAVMLPMKNPTDRRAWRATVHGVAESQTRLSAHTHALILSRRTP